MFIVENVEPRGLFGTWKKSIRGRPFNNKALCLDIILHKNIFTERFDRGNYNNGGLIIPKYKRRRVG
jgi:hypothetical protein